MKFSKEQENAIKAVSKWHKKGEKQIFRLFGFAGTGKTTIAQHIAEHIGGEVYFAAFTGKAALMLRKRGAEEASTIHSLIYHLAGEEIIKDKDTGKSAGVPVFKINEHSPVCEAELIIIDECSMVDEQLGKDLLSFKTPVLVLGDPGQLPPISGAGFFTEHQPDILLENIHRQAQDNPIIELAHQVRKGQKLKYGKYGETKVINKYDVEQEDVVNADQVLVGINKTRRSYNQRLRELKGFDDILPCHGDKMVALRNDLKKGLLNGSLWHVVEANRTVRKFMNLEICNEDEMFMKEKVKVKILKSIFEEPDTPIPYATRKQYDEFDYGYALTVHKSQGSQWDSTYVFNESYAFRDHASRWLYTAITRAAKKTTIVQ